MKYVLIEYFLQLCMNGNKMTLPRIEIRCLCGLPMVTTMFATQAIVCHFATQSESISKARNEFE